MEEGSTSKSLAGSKSFGLAQPFDLTMPPFRFERELEALRKEIAESAAKSAGTSGTSTPGSLSRGSSHTDLQALGEDSGLSDSPEPVLSDTRPEFTTEPLEIKKFS
jgi:hypothetical protein